MKVYPAVLELLHVERPTDGHGEAITVNLCKTLLRLRRGPDKSDHRVLGVSSRRAPFSVVAGCRRTSYLLRRISQQQAV